MSVILNVSSRVLVMALISNLGSGALFAFDLHWYTLIHTTLEKCVKFYLLLQLLCKLGQLFFASLVIDLHPIGIFAPTLFRVNIYHAHTLRMYQESSQKKLKNFFARISRHMKNSLSSNLFSVVSGWESLKLIHINSKVGIIQQLTSLSLLVHLYIQSMYFGDWLNSKSPENNPSHPQPHYHMAKIEL